MNCLWPELELLNKSRSSLSAKQWAVSDFLLVGQGQGAEDLFLNSKYYNCEYTGSECSISNQLSPRYQFSVYAKSEHSTLEHFGAGHSGLW